MSLLRECERPMLAPIYFDWNSTSPPHPTVVEAMRRAAMECWANPASVHGWGRRAKHLVESVRDLAAECIGAHPRDVLFTSGGTEANNWALDDAPGLVVSRLEHPSITKQAERLAGKGRPVKWVSVVGAGQVNPDAVRAALLDMPPGSVVATMAVNHETGIVQPIEAIANVAHEFGAFLHVDAVQALGKLPLNKWTAWDSVAVAAHKIRGPKGVGVFAWKAPRPLPRPLLTGGGQERGLRPGTVDPVNIAGFGTALARLGDHAANQSRLRVLRDKLEHELSDVMQRNVGPSLERLSHVASLFAPTWPAEELVAAMDLEGVCISAGSACSAGTSEISPVIEAMLGTARARSTVRVSLGELTTETEIDLGLEAFHRVLRRS